MQTLKVQLDLELEQHKVDHKEKVAGCEECDSLDASSATVASDAVAALLHYMRECTYGLAAMPKRRKKDMPKFLNDMVRSEAFRAQLS